jgi:hypothetical protein
MEARFLGVSFRCVFTVLRCSGFQIGLTKLHRNKHKTLLANLEVRTCCQTDRHTEEYLYIFTNCYECANKYVHRHVRSNQTSCRWVETAGTWSWPSPFKTRIRSVWSHGPVSSHLRMAWCNTFVKTHTVCPILKKVCNLRTQCTLVFHPVPSKWQRLFS